MEQKIVFATGNEGKMREVRLILQDLGFPVLSMKEAGVSLDIEENGTNIRGKCHDQSQGGLGEDRWSCLRMIPDWWWIT